MWELLHKNQVIHVFVPLETHHMRKTNEEALCGILVSVSKHCSNCSTNLDGWVCACLSKRLTMGLQV